MLEAAHQLISLLKARGPEKPVDIDDAAQRVALEVLTSPLIHIIP